MHNLLFCFILASAFIPARISGFLAPNCATNNAFHCTALKVQCSFQPQIRLRASETDGMSHVADVFDKAAAVNLSPAKLEESVPLSDVSNFPRRAMMLSAAFGQLGPFFGLGRASAIDMQNAAGLGINKQPSGKKPAPGSKAAQLAIFQDETLGYAFALPPGFKEVGSQGLDDGGQVLVFADEASPTSRVTLIAQRTNLATLTELQQSFVPQGTLLNREIRVKDSGRPDGAVYEYEFKTEEVRFLALFALRLKSPTEGGNWIITVSCQAPVRDFPAAAGGFREIVRGFRLTYPEVKGKAALDAESIRLDKDFGKEVGEATNVPQAILDMPWGGY